MKYIRQLNPKAEKGGDIRAREDQAEILRFAWSLYEFAPDIAKELERRIAFEKDIQVNLPFEME